MINVKDAELQTVEAFIAFLRDEERLTYTVDELSALNTNTHSPQHEIKAALAVAGFHLAVRQTPRRVRGYTTSSLDRWFGPGSDQTHGGGGF